MTGWRKRQVAAQSKQDMPKIGCVNHDCAQCKAQPEQKRPQNCGTGYCSCVECVMEPKQEPVGEAHQMSELVEGFTHCIWDERVIPVGTKLYTSPPAQRTWVGLTDVEWMNIVNKDQAWFGQRPDEVAHEVAKLVEAKLKEKNFD